MRGFADQLVERECIAVQREFCGQVEIGRHGALEYHFHLLPGEIAHVAIASGGSFGGGFGAGHITERELKILALGCEWNLLVVEERGTIAQRELADFQLKERVLPGTFDAGVHARRGDVAVAGSVDLHGERRTLHDHMVERYLFAEKRNDVNTYVYLISVKERRIIGGLEAMKREI